MRGTACTRRLPFLSGAGERQALIVQDRAADPAAVDVKSSTRNAKQSLTIDLRAAGGFIARFTEPRP